MKKTITLLLSFSPIFGFLGFIIFKINPLNKFLYIINGTTWIFNNISAIEMKYIIYAIILIGIIIKIYSFFKRLFY